MHSPVLTQEVYPNPERFELKRFLKDGGLDKSVCDPTNFTFGFGRRCVRCSAIATYRFWQSLKDLSWSTHCSRFQLDCRRVTSGDLTIQQASKPPGRRAQLRIRHNSVSLSILSSTYLISDWVVTGILLLSNAWLNQEMLERKSWFLMLWIRRNIKLWTPWSGKSGQLSMTI